MVGRCEIPLVLIALTISACAPPKRDRSRTSTLLLDGGGTNLSPTERRIAHQARGYGSRPSPTCPPFPEQAVLDRTYVAEALDTLGAWRPIPRSIDGIGFSMMLVGLHPDSFFDRLGFCSGDVMFDSEGELIASPLDAQAALERLRTASSVGFTIRRRGVWGQLTVIVVDP
jgi:hypothetical protein